MLRNSVLAILVVLGIGLVAGVAQDCPGPEPTGRRMLRNHAAVFVGTVVSSDESTTRFQVTERFHGKLGRFVDISRAPTNHFQFEPGRQYLVFAGPCPWESGKACLTLVPCGRTRSLEYAPALVKQMRADRNGKLMASVYGMLIFQEREGQRRPLPNTVVRLRRGTLSFEARTDEQGAYAFGDLEPGTYRVSADLPPNMEIAGYMGSPEEPFDLPSHSSFEKDIYVFPTGRITGMVIGPYGRPLDAASVSLYRPDQYREGKPGMHSYQALEGPHGKELKPFEFDHLAAGDYLLVFNFPDLVEPEAPFHRTFYPRSARVEDAQIIHLASGQQVTNADIHVDNASAVREITVRIAWSGRDPKEWMPVSIVARGRGSENWLARPQAAPYTYTLALWKSVQYAIQATTSCRTHGSGEAKTNAVAVDGGDSSVSEITLTFDKSWCANK